MTAGDASVFDSDLLKKSARRLRPGQRMPCGRDGFPVVVHRPGMSASGGMTQAVAQSWLDSS